MKFALISVVLFSSNAALASQPEPVSLLQESQEIECTLKDGDKTLSLLWIDKKDYVLKITRTGGQVEEYDQVKFLDRGVLAEKKSAPGQFIFFQIFTNGETQIHQGRRLRLKEADCDDTGASKKCKNSEIGELIWTPERLELKNKDIKIRVDITQYGFFPNNATFAYGVTNKLETMGYPSILLMDYGAPVELLVGHSTKLNCAYKKAQPN